MGDDFKEKRRADAQMIHIQVQNYETHVSKVSYIHTRNTKHTVLDFFNVCSNHAQVKLRWTRIQEQFAVDDFDKPVTFK